MEKEKEQKINDVMNEICDLISDLKSDARKSIVFNSIKKCILEDEKYFDLDLICELCKDFCCYEKFDISDLIETIINSKSVEHNYLIAKNVEGLDAGQRAIHENIVIESGNPEYCYLYARNIETANQKLLEEALLNAKSAKYSYLFAKDVRGATIDKHRQVVLDSKDAEYNYLFASNISYMFVADVYEHVQAIIDSENIEYCVLAIDKFSFNAALAKNFEKLAVLKKDSYLCYTLAKRVHGLDNALLGTTAMEDDTEFAGDFNYRFAKEIENADVKGHGAAVIRNGNAEWNYYFAKDIPGADIKAHGDVVLASGNVDYNFAFARDVEGANIIAHLEMCQSKRDSERETFCELSKQANGIEKIKKLIFDLNKPEN